MERALAREDEAEDGSEINWPDDAEGDDEDNAAEYGFDLKSTGNEPLLDHWRRRRQSPRSGSGGNQKGIKLNSNYHEDAEIGAARQSAPGPAELAARGVATASLGLPLGLPPQSPAVAGKRRECDWAKVRSDNYKRAARMGLANEEINGGNRDGSAGDADTIHDNDVEAVELLCGGVPLVAVGAGAGRFAASHRHHNNNADDDANRCGGASALASDAHDELETVVLRLAETPPADAGRATRGDATLATTCVT